MVKRWVYKTLADSDEIQKLSEEINVNKVLAGILLQRGVKSFDEAKNFFRPALKDLHDPFLMQDMDLAVKRITQAIKQREKILIYGDYDVDGTTSVTLVHGFIKSFYPNCEYYIPNRYTEGYGVSQKGIEWARENNIKLIISLDCGIKAVDKVQLAKDFGIDFIICDHHNPGEILPPAVAVLDPKRKDCNYPFNELSGCGVGFKFMQALTQSEGMDSTFLFDSLDLVAVSIASDIVPVTGENRILAYFGLEKLNKRPSEGLKALINLANQKKKLTISSIVFGVGPRINAAGRMEHAHGAVELLLSKTPEEAVEHSIKIDANNEKRRDYDSNITAEALEMIAKNPLVNDLHTTVLYKSDWHKGVIGIVASRCIEHYYRPTIILTESNRKATGSARSVEGFNVYEALLECKDLLDQFGGHKYAAGLTMDIENVEEFKERFEQVVRKRISPDLLIPKIEVDYKLPLDQINYKFFNVLKQMAPFGPLNMQPVFVSEDLRVYDRAYVLKNEHLKLKVIQEGASDAIEAIGFGLGKYCDLINSGMRFNMAYTLEENNYMGNRSLQLFIKDLKFE